MKDEFKKVARACLRPVHSPNVLRYLMAPLMATMRIVRVYWGQMGKTSESILLVKLDGIGDFVLCIPLFQQLERRVPHRYTVLVTTPQNAELAKGMGLFDEVIEFDGKWNGQLQHLRSTYRIMRLALGGLFWRSFQYALVPRWDVDAYGACLLAWLSGAGVRMGYSEHVNELKEKVNRGYDGYLTHALDRRQCEHEVERNLHLLRLIGQTTEQASPVLEVSETSSEAARVILRKQGIIEEEAVIGLAVGASARKRVWPLEQYGQIAEWLHEKFGLRCLVLGSNADSDMGEELTRLHPSACVNIAGKTSLPVAAAVLRRCIAYVGNDSGLAHIACAVGIPTVVISCHPKNGDWRSANAPERFRPLGCNSVVVQPDCATSPCVSECSEVAAHCIKGISYEYAKGAIERLFGRIIENSDNGRLDGAQRILPQHENQK